MASSRPSLPRGSCSPSPLWPPAAGGRSAATLRVALPALRAVELARCAPAPRVFLPRPAFQRAAPTARPLFLLLAVAGSGWAARVRLRSCWAPWGGPLATPAARRRLPGKLVGPVGRGAHPSRRGVSGLRLRVRVLGRGVEVIRCPGHPPRRAARAPARRGPALAPVVHPPPLPLLESWIAAALGERPSFDSARRVGQGRPHARCCAGSPPTARAPACSTARPGVRGSDSRATPRADPRATAQPPALGLPRRHSAAQGSQTSAAFPLRGHAGWRRRRLFGDAICSLRRSAAPALIQPHRLPSLVLCCCQCGSGQVRRGGCASRGRAAPARGGVLSRNRRRPPISYLVDRGRRTERGAATRVGGELGGGGTATQPGLLGLQYGARRGCAGVGFFFFFLAWSRGFAVSAISRRRSGLLAFWAAPGSVAWVLLLWLKAVGGCPARMARRQSGARRARPLAVALRTELSASGAAERRLVDRLAVGGASRRFAAWGGGGQPVARRAAFSCPRQVGAAVPGSCVGMTRAGARLPRRHLRLRSAPPLQGPVGKGPPSRHIAARGGVRRSVGPKGRAGFPAPPRSPAGLLRPAGGRSARARVSLEQVPGGWRVVDWRAGAALCRPGAASGLAHPRRVGKPGVCPQSLRLLGQVGSAGWCVGWKCAAGWLDAGPGRRPGRPLSHPSGVWAAQPLLGREQLLPRSAAARRCSRRSAGVVAVAFAGKFGAPQGAEKVRAATQHRRGVAGSTRRRPDHAPARSLPGRHSKVWLSPRSRSGAGATSALGMVVGPEAPAKWGLDADGKSRMLVIGEKQAVGGAFCKGRSCR